MGVVLDLADIQGNILQAYGKQGYLKGRLILLHVDGQNATAGAAARRFVSELIPEVATARSVAGGASAAPGAASNGGGAEPLPLVALNLAFTFYGLIALGVPTRTLSGLPDEFIDGMAKRAPMLGDDFIGTDWRNKWDEVWRPSEPDRGQYSDKKKPHILVTLNALVPPDELGKPSGALVAMTDMIVERAASLGLSLLKGHSRNNPEAPYQDISVLYGSDGKGGIQPFLTEHFGLTDGISDPVFEGQGAENDFKRPLRGNGAVDGEGNWRPIATGEFLLGYPDEAQETPGSAMPLDFSRNGTFMAYRKLHENVRAWNDFIDGQADRFAKVWGIADKIEAKETLIAKMVGRWSDGVPLMKAKDYAAWQDFRKKFTAGTPDWWREVTDFRYRDDPKGGACPMTSHTRRVNMRDSLDPVMTLDPPKTESAAGSVLNNRRRILRRGLPYGAFDSNASDSEERGVLMLIVCASLFRQFEFVQQQWINYGLDARAGNDTCPIVGNHAPGAGEVVPKGPKAKFVIPAPEGSNHPPFIIEGIPQFIETRGGEYFFVPSLTALRMIGMGSVDPT